VICRNPLLAEERVRKRGELLDATEEKLDAIAASVRRVRKPLRGTDKIALAVGRVIDHYKMAKHFTITITDDALTFTRNAPQIAAEAALDGVYVLRTSLEPATLDAAATPTSSSPTLSAPSAASRPSTSRSARSITAALTACARSMSLIMWNGTCAKHRFAGDIESSVAIARVEIEPF
jgi:hypothetical protein